MVYAFNSSTGEGEPGRSLNSRSAWSKEWPTGTDNVNPQEMIFKCQQS